MKTLAERAGIANGARMSTTHSAALRSMFALLLLACDGEAPVTDAGVSRPVVLTVDAASAAGTVEEATGGVRGASPGNQFYIIDLTIEAREVGPIPVAPNAFTLRLAGGARATASPMVTNLAENGCVSRSLPLGESASCRAVFEVAEDAAAPEQLEWSDGTRTVSAPVPAL